MNPAGSKVLETFGVVLLVGKFIRRIIKYKQFIPFI